MQRLHQNARRSRAIIVNNMVYLSGQYADDTDTGIQGQTEQILHKIDDLLAEAGTDRSKLVQVAIWLKTMDDYDGFNAVWDAWVIPGHTPTRPVAKSKWPMTICWSKSSPWLLCKARGTGLSRVCHAAFCTCRLQQFLCELRASV